MEKSCKTCRFDCTGCKPIRNDECCIEWQPKEEPKVEEKLYTTGQMIDLLLENPKMKAQLECGEDNNIVVGGSLYWERCIDNMKNNRFVITKDLANKKWRIIEPEPQKVSFVEAWKAHTKRDKIIVSNIGKEYKFSVNGLFWATDEEIDGEWIVLD